MTSRHSDSPLTVSVIMNCYNCQAYLAAAIDSVFAQTYPHWEIVFWDNASEDKSASIARGYGPRVRYHRSEQTQPLGKARNLALAQAKGDLVAFLDCDDLWLPQKLERQVPLFEKNSRVGLVFCDTFFFNDTGRKKRLYQKVRPRSGRVFEQLFQSYFLSMETVVIRRSALKDLDEWFVESLCVAEEKELFLRLAYQWELDYVDAPLAQWRVHPNSGTHQRYDLFAEENAFILSRWRERLSGFDRLYPDVQTAMEQKIVWQRSLAQLIEGRYRKARQTLEQVNMPPLRMRLAKLAAKMPAPLLHLLVQSYFRRKWL